MPGLFGLISRRPSEDCQQVLQQMHACMLSAQQPVLSLQSGWWGCPALGLHAGWVALPGSLAARHSACASGSSLGTLMAGECFSSQGPIAAATIEALASRHEAAPEDFVAGLNGLFCGLQADLVRGEVRLFNDRYGAERLYLHESDGELYFASEAKALLAVLPQARRLDMAGLADFLELGSVQSHRTLFQGISLLPGGSLWRIDLQGRIRRGRYFAPDTWAQAPALAPAEFEQAFDATLSSRIPAYFGEGEAIGLSLTGGLDTRMIMAALPSRSPAPVCYTYAGPAGETRDVTIARQIAQELGLSHHVLALDNHFLSDYQTHLDRTVWVTDGCAGAVTAHELSLSEQASALAPIRMTGNFGSEVLRGMSTRKRLALPPGLLDRDAAQLLAATRAAEPPHSGLQSAVGRAAFEEIPWHLYGPMAAARSCLSFRTPYLDNDVVALAHRAPPSLQRAAGPALGFIARHHRSLARRPTDRAQCLEPGLLHPVARAWAELTFKLDYYHSEGLPRRLRALAPVMGALEGTRLLGQHKFLTYRQWFAGPLAGWIRDTLCTDSADPLGLWNRGQLRRMVEQHLSGRASFTREIHLALTLNSVQKQFCGQAAARLKPRTAAPGLGTAPANRTLPHGA